MKLSIQAKTDIGPRRRLNQDEFYVDEAERLFIVSDGTGKSTKEGVTSSEIGVRTIATYLPAQSEPQTWPFQMNKAHELCETHLRAALKLANHALYQEGLPLEEEWDMQSFAASVAVLWLLEESAFVAHVGDCRVYRMRNGRLDQLTEDHSLLNDYIKMNKLTPEEIESFPHKNVITRALGLQETVQVDVLREKVSLGDLYLLCTDGLHDNLTDKEIAEILSQEDLSKISEQLFDRVYRNELADNSTIILVRCE
jgi:serine/threonine protein phosphatase PrpC